MTVIHKSQLPASKEVIDLDGPAGNPFQLIALLRSCLKRSKLKRDEIDEIINPLKIQSYDQIVSVVSIYLDSKYTFVTSNKALVERMGKR